MNNSSSDCDLRFVLIETSHAGNIGAAARAIKTMGFSRLTLVRPCRFKTYECYARASGADDVIDTAAVADSLPEAIADCVTVIGTTARSRSLSWPAPTVREVASELVSKAQKQPVAVIFGRERSGLSNEELALCSAMLTIPSSSEFSSLNLAAAVQVVAYELHCARALEPSVLAEPEDRLASQDQLERLYKHFASSMTQTGFFDPDNPRLLMPRLRRIFNRTELTSSEVQLLRGFLSAVEKNQH